MGWRGRIIRTGVPILPAAGRRREQALYNDGYAVILSSYKKYGKTLMDLSACLTGDLRVIPDHDFYRKDPPRVLAGAGSATTKLWSPLKQRVHHSPKRYEMEKRARQALDDAISAFHFFDELSDRPYLAETAHIQAHRCAEVVGNIFGCFAEYEDGKYWDVCALQLMHLRMGLSAGMNTVRCCSICLDEIDMCEHQLDEEYEIVADRSADGICTACGGESCSHAAGDVVICYPTVLHRDIQLNEVTIVRFPRDPLARIAGLQITEDKIPRLLEGRDRGDLVACRRCTGPCRGFAYPADGPDILSRFS